MSHINSEISSEQVNSQPISSSLAFIAIAAAACLNPVNGSLIVTAYPELAKSFGLPYAHVSALVMYFLAATAAAQPLAGALGDYFGRKNIFICGILGFSASSIAAGYSVSFDHLVIWRVTQALFSGIITANAASLVNRVIPETKLTTYLGFLGSAIVGATAFSFPLGGFLIKTFDWHVLFWCSVPIGAVSLLLVLIYVPGDKKRETKFTSLSFLGIPFIPLALFAQAKIQKQSLLEPFAFFLGTSAIVLLAIAFSKKSKNKFSNINNSNFNLSSAVAFFSAAITFSLMFMLPAWTSISLAVEPAELGIYLSTFTISMMMASPFLGRHIDRQGYNKLKIPSIFCVVVGLSLLIYLLSKTALLAAMITIGTGIAIAQLISQRSSLLSAPKEDQALAMGIFTSYRSVGCIAGNGLAAALFASSSTVTSALGTTILMWILVIFGLPLAASQYLLMKNTS